MALALDEPLENDTIAEQDGFKFCISNELLAQVGGVKIDLSYTGFTLEPDNPLNQGDSACGSCGTFGSCSV